MYLESIDYEITLGQDFDIVCMWKEEGNFVKSALRVKIDVISPSSMCVNIAWTIAC